MRFRLTLALSVSVLLILGAGSTRFSDKSSQNTALIAVEEPLRPQGQEASDAEMVTTSTASASLETPLSDTDLVSRQLFSDYFGLAYRGQATPENIDALAGAYADSIANLDKSNYVTATELNIVPNSLDSLKRYGDLLKAAYIKYQTLLAREFNNAPDSSIIGPGLASFSDRVGDLYQSEADEFKAMPVPQAVLGEHLGLVNTYLRSATSYHSLAGIDGNPVEAMAGISMASKGLVEETELLGIVLKTLSANGIIMNNQ